MRKNKIKNGVIIIIVVVFFYAFLKFMAWNCSNNCFRNRDGQTWCEGNCWNEMNMFGIKPNPTLSECEMWGICGINKTNDKLSGLK